MLIPVAALAVHADGEQQILQSIVIGEAGAAIAIAAQRLGREKAGRGRIADGARPLAVPKPPEPLSRVAKQLQALAGGDRRQRAVVGGLAEQIDRHHRLGLQGAVLLHQRDRGFQAGWVHVEGIGQDIDEHRRGAGQDHHLAAGGKGEGWDKDGISRPDIPGPENQQQSIRTVGAGNRVLDPRPGRQIALQLAHLRAQDPLPALDGGFDSGLQRRSQAAALGLQIDELDRVGHGLTPVRKRTAFRARGLHRATHLMLRFIEPRFAPFSHRTAG
jgi:hypothetical protein